METFLKLQFMADEISILFSILSAIVFITAGIYSFSYMRVDKHPKRYTVFYILSFGMVEALCFAGNMVTFYLFFEMLALVSFPLVLHNGTKESTIAGLKYLFYSLCGAYMALFGLVFTAGNSSFTDGRNVMPESSSTVIYVCLTLMIMGFGVVAGLFPMHAWIPTAHMAAPAPVSAMLSAVVVNGGVLGIIRTVLYVYDESFIKGNSIQYAWMIIALITVFIGAVLAFRENDLKKRIAYSTVSQMSYIMFGLSTFTEMGYKGAIVQVIAHGLAVCGLFLCVGAIIDKTGRTKVSELRGIGKQMPLTMICFTILSLSLTGIPPMGGFIANWYIVVGSLNGNAGILNWLGPVILLLACLLTAGYLLPIAMRGFFPGVTEGENGELIEKEYEKSEPDKLKTVPIVILTILSALAGILPNVITNLL